MILTGLQRKNADAEALPFAELLIKRYSSGTEMKTRAARTTRTNLTGFWVSM